MKSILTNKAVRMLANTFCFNRVRKRGNNFIGAGNTLRVRCSIQMSGGNNTISLGSGIMHKTNIYIKGSGNELVIESGFRIQNSQIWIMGDNCKIRLGNDLRMNNSELSAEKSASRLVCGNDTQIGGFVWLVNRPNRTRLISINTGDGRDIKIGHSVRIAEGSIIKNSDSHPIYDITTNEILNRAKDVFVGNKAWICPGALMLKGSGVGDGCIIGAQSVLTKDYSAMQNVLLVGSPAKIVKENVGWRM